MSMNRNKWSLTGAAATVAVLATTTAVLARPSGAPSLNKTAFRDQQTLGVNNWGLEITNYGSFGYDIAGSNAGGEFPRGSGYHVLFAGGFQFGTLVDGTPQVSQVEFESDFQPGAIINVSTIEADSLPPLPVGDLLADDPAGPDQRVLMATRTGELPTDWPDTVDVIGDAATYATFNDLDATLSSDAGQAPLGIEVSQHSFAFAKQGAQGDIVYLRFFLSNKSDQNYTDSYAEVWFDPDNGSAGNDLTGSDVETSLGYVYNADEESRNTAMGADFFQGPIVSDTTSTVVRRGGVTFNKTEDYEFIEGDEEIEDQRVLGMSAFSFYINGTDPDTDEERYNLMRGLTREGVTRTNGPFDYAGDPVTGEGVNDAAPNDKRMALITGPFTLGPGETQEVVVAIIAAEVTSSEDPLVALTALRETDREAQIAYDFDYIQQAPPPPPVTIAYAYDGEALLTWDSSPENAEDTFGEKLSLGELREVQDTTLVITELDSLGNVISYEEVIGTTTIGYDKFDFQGYRVYRSETGDTGSWELLAEYDVVDGVTEVAARVFNNTLQEDEVSQLHIGTDSGLAYFFNDIGLQNGRPYYYSVTSYDYQPMTTLERTLESLQTGNMFRVVPKELPAGYDYAGASADVDSLVEHTGTSDGSVTVSVVDPSKVTGDDYMVTFRDFEKVTLEGDTVTVPGWDLINESTGDTVLAMQENQAGDAAYQVADGLLVKVIGPQPGWKENVKGNPMIDEVIAVAPDDVPYT
ncbi:MAG: hypothetical protein CME06_06810, partial [Gemmatimonadetes bacterium]|nr:hypothetical protein [Gemmatimonadota bacterium]